MRGHTNSPLRKNTSGRLLAGYGVGRLVREVSLHDFIWSGYPIVHSVDDRPVVVPVHEIVSTAECPPELVIVLPKPGEGKVHPVSMFVRLDILNTKLLHVVSQVGCSV